MSTLTIPTKAFIGLLSDVIRTAGDDPEVPTLSTVLLHSDRGDWVITDDDSEDGAEPLIDTIPSDLLIGSSTNRYAVGQAHTACEGRLHRPVVVAVAEAKVIVSGFRPAAAAVGKDVVHRVIVTLEGNTLTVTEDPTLIPDGLSVSFPVTSGDDFPRFADLMDPDPFVAVVQDGEVVLPSRGTVLAPVYLAAFAAIGKRRAAPVILYRHHQGRPLVVEIGSAYRGLVMPAPRSSGESLDEPEIRVFVPDVHDSDGAL